jgi:hypothetical protein
MAGFPAFRGAVFRQDFVQWRAEAVVEVLAEAGTGRAFK